MAQCPAPWLDAALTIIKRWEGLRLSAYLCPAGIPTIGYGQTGPEIKLGLRWTQAQADEALLEEVRRNGRAIDACVSVPLSSNEKAALVSLVHNIGITAFRKSTLLTLLNRGGNAADQFLRWNRANGKVMRGLTNRRAEERALFLRA